MSFAYRDNITELNASPLQQGDQVALLVLRSALYWHNLCPLVHFEETVTTNSHKVIKRAHLSPITKHFYHGKTGFFKNDNNPHPQSMKAH